MNAWWLTLCIALVACTFDSAPLRPHDGSDTSSDAGPMERDAVARTADAAVGDTTTSLADAHVPTTDASEAADDVAPDTTSSEDAPKDAGADVGSDASEDERDGDAKDAGPDCGAHACHCPHEAPDKGACPSLPCDFADCAPGDDCRYESDDAVGGYYVCDDEVSWEDARDACASRDGMHLAAIETKGEDDYLFSLIDDKTWVGASDLEQEGTWQWTDGTAFYDQGGFMSGPIDDAYENWDGAEPNNLGLGLSAADCMILWYDNLDWADARCDDEHGYVCEVVPSN